MNQVLKGHANLIHYESVSKRGRYCQKYVHDFALYSEFYSLARANLKAYFAISNKRRSGNDRLFLTLLRLLC